MGNIVLLDELTINQIAAGEVIERPASVIKEMVENSIDAGATSINIEIRNGGISYIRIVDNGKGIKADDMELAFERHATSKIRTAADLNSVTSMGFRGEALASIAAIAKVEMISKTPDSSIGNRIIVEGGKVIEQEETGCSNGTTITVQNLFFNTPVRYKFLKKDYTESGYIEDAITRLALVNPHIAFKLINSGKTVIQTSGNGNMQDVIYAIYGKDIATGILEVDYQYEEIHVTGVIGKPEIARSNRSNQIFFVNKRYVKDKTLAGAAESAFKGLLPIGKYGFLILNIEMSPSKVDVNVHPAKLEVRFQEENMVFKAIYHAIKDTLLKTELVAKAKKVEQTSTDTPYTLEQPKNNGIANLFRKIASTQEKERNEDESNNIIQDIYNGTKLESKPETMENTTPNVNPTISEETPKAEKLEIFEKLLEMQKKVREEAENNPNIHTKIDTLMQDTKNLEQGYNQENGIVQTKQIQQEENTQPVNTIENTVTTDIPKQSVENPQESEINPLIENSIQQDQQQAEPQPPVTEETIKIDDIKNKLSELEHVGETSPEFVSMYQKTFGKLPATAIEKKREEDKKINAYDIIKDNNISVFEHIEEYNKPQYKFIGIVFKTYIILEMGTEMYILDQHAAHERIMYEKVKANYYAEGEKDSQLLLLPDIITLSHKEMDIARDNMKMFEKAGFMVEEFGDNTIKLSGVPNICLNLDTKELFMETLDEINTVARTAKQEIEEKFIATVACKAAVKANMALTAEEVDSLMEELLKLPNPFTCPHGRPTVIKMDKTDIEKKFARRK